MLYYNEECVVMASSVRAIIRKTLKDCGAGDVSINRVKGVTKSDCGIMIDTLYLSMGNCDGDEFDGIKAMRQNVELFYKMNITNILISL